MTLKDNIKKLSALSGVSGHEHKVAEEIYRMFYEYADEVYINNLGSVVAKRKGSDSNSGSVMIEAHMDEIGLMITGINDKGYLKFTNIGGIDTRILLGMEVVVHAKTDIPGIIGAKPPHLMTADERDKSVSGEDLFIDVGYSKEECEKIVKIGDVVTFSSEATCLMNDYICAKSQDDRTCVAALCDIMEELKGIDIPYDIYFVAAVCEEVTGSGAITSAYEINPDFAIVLDVTHGDTPDASSSETFKTGEGQTVIAMGPNIHPSLFRNIGKIMDEAEIKYSLEIEGGNTGTDAWGIQIAREGIPCALFSVPLRYMHTSCEVVNLLDVKITAYAISTFLKSIDKAGDALC